MHQIEINDPVTEFGSLENSLVRERWANERLAAYILSSFSLEAMFLAVSGVYSVMSLMVLERGPEFAIRLAMGAGKNTIVKHVLWPESFVIVSGIGLGLTLCVPVQKVFADQGITFSWNLGVIALICSLIIICATLASLVPAYRACRVDPMKALRNE